MPVVGIGAGLVGGLVKGLVGGKQKREGKKILNGLQYPTEQVPQEEIENQNLARQQAATGLPSEQYANAMKNIQRSQLLAIRGAHDRRGGLGSIAGIQQGTNDATLNLDTADAKQKLVNQQNFMNTNNRLASWKDKVWQNNVMGKYQQQYGYAQSLLGAGNQNVSSGLDQAIGGLGAGAAGFYGNTSGLFGGGGGGNSLYPYTKQVGNIPQNQIF